VRVDVFGTSTGLEIGLVATAFALGFRHGFDWDHLAALSDIAASQQSRRRSMMLATLYALGHAAVAFAIGAAVIVASAHLPEAVGEVMERLVGVTLVALGLWVIVSTLHTGRSTRMPSRGALLVAGFRRLRRLGTAPVVIEHEHEHPVGEPHEHDHEHVHAHAHEPELVGAGPPTTTTHRHRHRHVAPMPDDPFPAYGGGTTFGVGMVHGIGFETPTQALVFVTAAGAGSRAAGLFVLVCFLVGLFAANTVVAVASTLGFTGANSRAQLYTVASLVAATASLALGLLYVFGRGDVMPG
jgi:ABC-type nickel/cobalt efflux system permease component RcnA